MNLINENRLYKIIGRFFHQNQNLLGELIQNSYRGNASDIEIKFGINGGFKSPFLLSIKDNGNGIKDFRALVGIAFSEWDKSVLEQEPAGIGFLQLLANAKTISVTSKFGSVEIDCKKFLNDESYRDSLISKRFPKTEMNSTYIKAEMKELAQNYIWSNKIHYSGYNCNISINGELVKKRNVQSLIERSLREQTPYKVSVFKGNSLYIGFGDAENFSYLKAVNWYGQIIPYSLKTAHHGHLEVLYEVSKGSPLSLSFPDRTSILHDEQAKEFNRFLNYEICEFLLRYFQTVSASNLERYTTKCLLSNFYELCDDEQRDKMPYIIGDIDPFCSLSSENIKIFLKSELLEKNYSYVTSHVFVDEKYRLATNDLKIILVSYSNLERGFEALRMRKITDISFKKNPTQNINIGNLKLIVSSMYHEDEEISLSNLLLASISDPTEFIVFGDSADDIYNNFIDNYHDFIYVEDFADSYDTQQEMAKQEFLDDFMKLFDRIDRGKFDFLPSGVKAIEFMDKELLLTFDDGTQKSCLMERL